MKYFLVFMALMLLFPVLGQEECYVQKDFLIIRSTKNYKEALSTVEKASQSLGIKMDLRSLTPITDTLYGLTFPPEVCATFSDTTCYIARGRSDDGVYLSIEYSTAFDNFRRGYYIVVAASGYKKDQEVKDALSRVKSKYPDAYIKSSSVYICCMH